MSVSESAGPGAKIITNAELALHNQPNDCWLAMEGKVYNVTTFLPRHPGGADNIMLTCGRDSTQLIYSAHTLRVAQSFRKKMEAFYVGELQVDPSIVSFRPISPFYKTLKGRVEAYMTENKLSPRFSLELSLRVPMLVLAIIALHVLSMYTFVDNLLLASFLALAHGWASALLCLTGVHEASHSAMSKRPWLWWAVGRLSHDLVGGASFFLWQNQHILGHHVFTNIHGADPDVAGISMGEAEPAPRVGHHVFTNIVGADPDVTVPLTILRFTPLVAWQKSVSYQYLYSPFLYGLLSMNVRVRDLINYFVKGYVGPIRINTGREGLVLVATKLWFVFYRFLLPFYLGIPPLQVLLLGALSDALGSCYLAFLFQCNHITQLASFPVPDPKLGVMENGWAEHQVLTTQDYGHDSYMTYWCTGALNYQVVHHLFPYITQGHYRSIAPIVVETCKEFNVPYIVRPNVWDACAAHLNHLRDMARDPSLKVHEH